MLCLFVRETGIVRTNRYVQRGLVSTFSLFLLIVASACGNSSRPASQTPTAQGQLGVSASLPAATVGASYDATLSATGGTAPYNFSVASGNLPSGILLDNGTGKISGTPSASGDFGFVVFASDASGHSGNKSLQITVADTSTTSGGGGSGSGSSGGGSGGSGSTGGGGSSNSTPSSTAASFTGLQRSAGWSQFGQGPPNFVDCSPSPCDGISFSMSQGIDSPSLSGSAGEFYIGGSVPYSDSLWNNHLIGPLSTQGKFDPNGTLVPSLHNFTYDVYFYGANLELAQALEFDVNQFFDNMGFIFGHECRIAGGNQWDVWDNQNARWVPTGVPCYPNNNAWNHVTIQMQRTSGNELVYQSITLNGQTSTLNWTFGHGSSPGWKGITINYQMDGNYRQDSYKVYLDNLTFTYD